MMDVEYWNNRYKTGTGAGAGSKGRLLDFKVQTIQKLIDRYDAAFVVDMGCGDGAVAARLDIKNEYLGLDISTIAIDKANQSAKENHSFHCYYPSHQKGLPKAFDIAISIDVIIHIEGEERKTHLKHLFALAEKAVIIYGVDGGYPELSLEPHMCYDEFVPYIRENFKGWDIVDEIGNDYSATKPDDPEGSYCSFYVFERNDRDSDDS